MARWLTLCLVAASVASCGTTQGKRTVRKHGKEYFAESEYGVKASPRVFVGKHPPKGGGRALVGTPYKVKGKWYAPKEDKSYDKVGMASWYGSAFHGRLTANGEIYDQFSLSAAHPTFPLPSYARVTNLENGSSLIVRVNDRGPYHPGRIIDLSDKAAELLDLQHHGTAKVRVQYAGKARMDGRDQTFLMASYSQGGEKWRRFSPSYSNDVMVASNDSKFVPRPKPAYTEVAAVRKVTPAAEPLAETAYQPAPVTAGESALLSQFEAYVMLPEIGPFPAERPQMGEHILGTLAAYAEPDAKASSPAFDAVLKKRAELTPELIRKAALKKNPGLY